MSLSKKMLSKKSQAGLIIIVLLIVLAGAAVYYYYFSGNANTNILSQDGGRMVFAITDAAVQTGSISKIMVTVDSIEAHSTTRGWITVSSSAKTFDLLELKAQNKLEIMSDATVDTGNYDQVRMQISKVVVVDSQGEHEAKLPSNELKINTDLEVNQDKTATATFDFIVDESLHVTGNGKYILAPVIQLETRSDADVNLESDNEVKIQGGSVNSNKKVGMDAAGNVDVGLRVPSNARLDIDTDGKIKVNGVKVGLLGSANANANSNAETDSNTETEVVVKVSEY